MSDHDALDHDALSCPQCQGMAQAASVLGGFAESMEKMIEDGTFYRMGQEMARRQNDAFWRAFLGETKGEPARE
jgi:hypothetical protein